MATPAVPLTRECPYCRETIRLDALKCKYCASSLLPAPDPAPKPPEASSSFEIIGKPDHVTYVVDSDLIRYVKAAAAALSIIVVVGAYIGGLDIRQAASEAHKAAVDAKASSDEIQKVNIQMATAKKEMDDSRAALAAKVNEATGYIDELRKDKVVGDKYRAGFIEASDQPTSITLPDVSAGVNQSFTPPELARLYNFPARLDGSGQTIAMIELDGGYRNDDLQRYFKSLKMPMPNITSVSVKGGANHPTTANSADGQVALDIEVAAAIAPKARIVVYFTSNTNEGFVAAINAAANNRKDPASIMLISWGGPESTWMAAAVKSMDEALQDATINHRITVVLGTGDNGVAGIGSKGQRTVEFPASSPWVLAVGGTTLTAQGTKIQTETVWNKSAQSEGATGGGVSNLNPQPDWQKDAHIPPFFGRSGRGIPDVAANADPSRGLMIRVDDQVVVIGGSTAASALWAGLIALLNQGLGRNLGYLNPALYHSVGPGGALNDITLGGNSVSGVQGCTAGPGWDYCSGWGTPNGVKLLEAFRLAPP